MCPSLIAQDPVIGIEDPVKMRREERCKSRMMMIIRNLQ